MGSGPDRLGSARLGPAEVKLGTSRKASAPIHKALAPAAAGVTPLSAAARADDLRHDCQGEGGGVIPEVSVWGGCYR